MKLYECYLSKKDIEAIQGLLEIARLAMPDTYFQTDRRVRAGQRLLRKLLDER